MRVVVAAGRGACGQLGHGDEESYCWPEPIEALRGVRVAAMAASECHSLVLTKEGEVLSFGEGYEGRPGLLPLHGGHVNMSVCFPAQITGLQTRGCIDPPPPSVRQANTTAAASARGAAGDGPLNEPYTGKASACCSSRVRAIDRVGRIPRSDISACTFASSAVRTRSSWDPWPAEGSDHCKMTCGSKPSVGRLLNASAFPPPCTRESSAVWRRLTNTCDTR